MEADCFLTTSLRNSPHGDKIARILAASINAVDPAHAVTNFLKRDQNQIHVGKKSYALKSIQRVFLIGFGKASLPMGQAAAEIIGDRLTQGILITKTHPSQFTIQDSSFTIFEAAHPVPDEYGVEGARQIIDLLQATTPEDLVIFLISGGGSALLTAPVPDISLADLKNLTKILLACGADINELNALRKHLSQVKGGNLARMAYPAQVISLILSDVIGDPLDVISSGPTSPDTSTYANAIEILNKYNIAKEMPSSILTHLQRGASGDIPETPKESDPVFERCQNIIVGNILKAAQTALKQAEREGFNTLLLTTRLKGEASQIGPNLAAIAQQINASGDPIPRSACIIAGGESTVTLQGDGHGGRNQEVALSAVVDLAGLRDTFLITLATDGDDGPTDAAGAVVSGNTLGLANDRDLDPAKFQINNNSYQFFDQLGDLLKPGPTLTNVNDLAFIFAL